MTLQEDNRFYAFAVRAMSEISGMPMSENLIIAGDDKIKGDKIISYEPGDLTQCGEICIIRIQIYCLIIILSYASISSKLCLDASL